jgi:hypothetical protein
MADYKTTSAGLCPGPCDSHDLYEPHPDEDEPQEQGLLPLDDPEPLKTVFFDDLMARRTPRWAHQHKPGPENCPNGTWGCLRCP